MVEIEDGNTIDLTPILGASGTDDQNLGPATLNASNMLTINIEGGNPTTVDLNPLAGGAADGSETIINTSPTVSVAGTGTTLDPYVLASSGGSDGSETIINTSPTVSVAGTGTALDPYLLTSSGGADGSETIINSTTTVTVAGTGTTADPYELTAIGGAGGTTEVVDGITLTGVGTGVDPFKIEPGADGQVLVTTGTTVAWDDPMGSGSTEEADQTTITGVGTNADPFKIEPSTVNGQFLRTDPTGNVIWDDLPSGTGGAVTSDGITIVGTGADAASALSVPVDGITDVQIANGTILAEDLNNMGATDGQILKWDDASTSWALAADDTGAAALTDGNIFVGDATNTPQGVTLSGDATIDNLGALTIADDAITLENIDQNGATNGQVMKWDDATTSWVLSADDAGINTLTDGNIFVGDATNTLQEVTLSGDATIDNLGALTIADDAITSTKIENATILAEDLNAMGATADGDILQWNTALNAAAGGWEVTTNPTHTGTANHIFFADATTSEPVTSPNGGLVWDQAARFNSGALFVGLDGGVPSNDVKVHIAEQLTGANQVAYGLMLQNRARGIGNGTGILFSVDDFTTTFGKGALVFERTDPDWQVGDFHFLQNAIADATGLNNPDITTDKAFTIKSNKDIKLYAGLEANNGLGADNQVLSSATVAGQKVVQWVNAGGSGDNLSTTNLTQPVASLVRTYDLPNANQSLVFTGLGNVGIGNTANPPQNKLHVAGAVRSEGILNSDGNVGEPSYRFSGDTNTGMFWRAADDIGFTAGGSEAMRITRPTPTAETRVTINENLELADALLDKDGDAGTAGQILSSTGGANPQADWVDSNAPVQKGKVLAGSPFRSSAGAYTVPINDTSIPANYVLNVSVAQNVLADPIIIQIVSQSNTEFAVQIFQFDAGIGNFVATDADWHYTIYNP